MNRLKRTTTGPKPRQLKPRLSRPPRKIAQARPTAELIKALANPIRLQLMRELRDTDLTASDLVRVCGVSKANLSQHINLLKREGLVACVKRGTFCHYSLGDKRVLRALDLLEAVLRVRDNGKRLARARRRKTA